MDIQSAFERIEKVFNASPTDNTPRVIIVNVSSLGVLSELRARFTYPQTRILLASTLCRKDHILGRHDLLEALNKRQEPTVLMEFTSLWKLHGYKALEEELSILLNLSTDYPLVIVGYQCERVLEQIVLKDPRRERQILYVYSDSSNLPSVPPIFVWIAHDVEVETLVHDKKFSADIDGIDQIVSCIEDEKCVNFPPGAQVLVRTQAKKSHFPECVYSIREIDSPYSVAVLCDTSLGLRDLSDGTNEQWGWLLSLLNRFGCFEKVVREVLGLERTQLYLLDRYCDWTPNERWLYWLALKQFGTDNDYLEMVLKRSSNCGSLIQNIYRGIVEVSPRSTEFEKYSNQRRSLLRNLRNMENESSQFSQWILHKGFDALYYLTDLSRHEQEAILTILSNYLDRQSSAEVLQKIRNISPLLGDYAESMDLSLPHYIGHEAKKFINAYFERYRYIKLTNHLDEKFEETVQQEALETGRKFYKFQSRSAGIEKVCRSAKNIKTLVYFVDALGVEFVPYIIRHIKGKLHAVVDIYRANLPTVTKFNTEFKEMLNQAGIELRTTDKIDQLKHHQIPNVQFNKTDVPIHLIDELGELDKLLKEIESVLRSGVERVVVVSDHGASRLAVLSNKAKRIENVAGEHGGRYCLNCDDVKALETVTFEEVDGVTYAVSTNYDRLGGRKAYVETHGGATLEEVLVPFIELTLPKDNLKIEIILKAPKVEVSYKKCAEIILFSTEYVSSLSIVFTSNNYQSLRIDGETNDNRTFRFMCPQITSKGTLAFDVYCHDVCVCRGLTCEAVSKGMQEEDDGWF